MKFSLKPFWNDIKSFKNYDIYIAIVTSLTIAVLGVLKIVTPEIVIGVVLATLSVFMRHVLILKRTISTLDNSTQSLLPITTEINKRLGYSYDSSFLRFRKNIPDLIDEIENSKKISILGASLHSTSRRYYDAFELAIKNGASARFLTCEPSSKISSIQIMRTYKEKDAKRLSNEIKENLRTLSELKKVGNDENSCQLKTIPLIISYGIVILESPSGKKIFIKLMPFRTPGSQYPSFSVSQSENVEWYEFFADQFEKMWEVGTEFN